MLKYQFDEITIDGFRALRKLELKNLGLINLLVGENNSGKTSVLEAISILCNPYDPYEWVEMVARRDFGRLDENRLQSLKWSFKQESDLNSDPEMMFESRCEMTAKGKFPVRKLSAELKSFVGEPDPSELERLERILPKNLFVRRLERLQQSGVGVEITHQVESDLEAFQRTLFSDAGMSSDEVVSIRFWDGIPYPRNYMKKKPRLKCEMLTPYSYQIGHIQLKTFSMQRITSQNKDLVLELLNSFDSDITDVFVASLAGGRPAIYLNHSKLGAAPLSTFGDAVRRAALMAFTVPSLKKGGMLFIDEIETGIHVSALGKVFSWLFEIAKSSEMQIIATTHSLEAVDAIARASLENIDSLVTFHLDGQHTESSVKRIGGDLLFRLRQDRGLDVR